MDYLHYTALDFALDEHFQKWILCPDEETDLFWDRWQLQHPEKKIELEEARQTIHALQFKTDLLLEEQRHRMFQNILISIRKKEQILPLVKEEKTIIWYTNWKRIAAGLLIGTFAFSAISYWYLNQHIYYNTQYGEIKTITLPDQTKVTLNAHSTLHFERNWQSDKPREVWLEGEAFFEVSKKTPRDPAARFQVHTDDLTVEVLGTKFNVNQHEHLTAVSLNEGKIQLKLETPKPSKDILMSPGEMVKFSETNQKIEKIAIQAENQSSWTKNFWVLTNTSLAEIAKRIETTYGYEVFITNEQLLSESITGVLPTHNIKNLLDVLSTTYNVKIQITNNRITISK
ncbi:FecR domain-containing protein [Cytophagaceae bacterium DM2B3-1]|uniref:FecR domain-containing protein n=1 Tax=Xanthocytophaga flava TaxID=3048013 RepID=A0ABT7CDR3_9BACT|nr:FecR domain-containing protein [Xanthocytophaga flavus]MDJ1472700.1 FecR domain-containing protein [Xanthocytophaga flavus]MDJ1491880.1 FecR domain-containing protein [Xanthocytophaga flavus]